MGVSGCTITSKTKSNGFLNIFLERSGSKAPAEVEQMRLPKISLFFSNYRALWYTSHIIFISIKLALSKDQSRTIKQKSREKNVQIWRFVHQSWLRASLWPKSRNARFYRICSWSQSSPCLRGLGTASEKKEPVCIFSLRNYRYFVYWKFHEKSWFLVIFSRVKRVKKYIKINFSSDNFRFFCSVL